MKMCTLKFFTCLSLSLSSFSTYSTTGSSLCRCRNFSRSLSNIKKMAAILITAAPQKPVRHIFDFFSLLFASPLPPPAFHAFRSFFWAGSNIDSDIFSLDLVSFFPPDLLSFNCRSPDVRPIPRDARSSFSLSPLLRVNGQKLFAWGKKDRNPFVEESNDRIMFGIPREKHA